MSGRRKLIKLFRGCQKAPEKRSISLQICCSIGVAIGVGYHTQFKFELVIWISRTKIGILKPIP